jgi:hypothetical protein
MQAFRHGSQLLKAEAMKAERFVGHHEGSLSTFRRRGDRNHADREFAFADLLLRPVAQTAKPSFDFFPNAAHI